MIRTQISLEEVDYQSAKAEAKRLGISVAAFIHRAIRDKLARDSAKPWMRYAGIVTSGDPKSSLSVDEMVYGRND